MATGFIGVHLLTGSQSTRPFDGHFVFFKTYVLMRTMC